MGGHGGPVRARPLTGGRLSSPWLPESVIAVIAAAAGRQIFEKSLNGGHQGGTIKDLLGFLAHCLFHFILKYLMRAGQSSLD